MFFLYPITPHFNPNYIVLSAWVVFYTLVANIILLISTFKEKNPSKKYQKVLVSILAIPTTFLIMWTSYLSVALGYHEVWYLNIWIVLCMFIIFVIFALKYGVLGVRLKVERSNLDDTIDTLINGVSVISHAVKNEASTISLCVDTIRSLDNVSPGTEKKLTIIKESCKNLSEFTQKINNFRVYEMDFEPYVLNVLIDKVISQVLPLVSGKGIKINNNTKEDITLMLDAIHVTEVLKNLLINAIEAIEVIEVEGIINIKTELIEHKVCISVEDNGIGIPQEYIEKVVTPFYSTKKGKNNYGLGLSYCYKVMKCHKGSLKINSRINQGTTMSLLFPGERVL
jgi:signal transduction histidine kinase